MKSVRNGVFGFSGKLRIDKLAGQQILEETLSVILGKKLNAVKILRKSGINLGELIIDYASPRFKNKYIKIKCLPNFNRRHDKSAEQSLISKSVCLKEAKDLRCLWCKC